MMLLLSLVLLVTTEAGAMEVTRSVSSFTRSRVRFQYRPGAEDNQTRHEVVEARFAVGAPVLPVAGLLGKPSSSIKACQNVSKLSNEVKCENVFYLCITIENKTGITLFLFL